MRIHLIQPQQPFGPPEREVELRRVRAHNDAAGFDRITRMDGQPTFDDLLKACDPGAVNVIANSDIYFDAEAVAHLRTIKRAQAWALSRWDIREDGQAYLWDHRDSQDVWAFHGKPYAINAPYRMGVPGCDNRFAHDLMSAGFEVLNPSRTVRTFHLHMVDWRSYLHTEGGAARGGDKVDRVPPPYHFIKPHDL